MEFEATLYVPSEFALAVQRKILSSQKKGDLVNEVFRIQELFSGVDRVKYVTPKGKEVATYGVFDNLLHGIVHQFKKPYLVEMLAFYKGDPRNGVIVEVEVSPKLTELISEAARNCVVTMRQLGEVFQRGSQRYSYVNLPLSSYFPHCDPFKRWIEYDKCDSFGYGAYPRGDIYGALPFDRHLKCFKELYPEVDLPFAEDVLLPVGEDVVNVNLEASVGFALNILLQLYNSGGIAKGSTRLLTKPHGAKILEMLQSYDPFSATGEGVFNKGMHGMFAWCVALSFLDAADTSCLPKGRIQKGEMLPVLKGMFKAMDSLEHLQVLECMLPHISGMKKGDLKKFAYRVYVQEVKELLKVSGDGWLDVETFKRKVYSRCIAKDYGMFMFYGITASALKSSRTGRYVTPERVNVDLMYPFIEGVLGMLVGMGAVEAMVAPPRKGDRSMLGGMSHVRLTGLGGYLLGLTKSYTMMVNNSFAREYDVVNGPLLVYSRKEDNPYDKWLAEVAVKAGRYWRVDKHSFLSRCFSEGDIRERVETFRSVICESPGSEWEKLFDFLLNRSTGGVRPYAGDRLAIFEVDPRDRELHELLSVEPLSKLVIRVQGHRILVRVADQAVLAEELRKHGYIL